MIGSERRGWLTALRHLKSNELVRFGAMVFAAQTFVNVMNFAYHVLVSRRIGVVAYGSLNALIAAFMVASAPAIVLQTVVVKYAAEFRALGDTAHLRALFVRAAQALGLVAVCVLVAAALGATRISSYMRVDDTLAVMLVAGIVAFNFVLPVRGVLQGVENFSAFSISLSLEAAVKVVLAVTFVVLGWGLAGALGGWLIGTAIAAAYTYGVLWLKYRATPAQPLNVDVRRLIKTSLNVTLANLFVTSLGFSDVIIVKHFFDPQTAGLYGAAALCGKMIFLLVNFVPAVILPRAANLALAGRPTRAVLFQALALIAIMSAAGLLVYHAFPAAIVGTLTGAAFRPAAPLLFPYGIASTLLAILNALVFFKIGIHRFGFVKPLAVIAVAELVAIAIFHGTPLQVIYILIASNTVALAATLYGITPKPQAYSSSTGSLEGA